MVETKGMLLLVDDEISILNALKRVFTAENYQVFTGSSGSEGLKILKQYPSLDIIISDMRMPVMDGTEFLKIAANRWPHTQRILLTGYADINSAISAINEGKINYYIPKPWKNDEIISVVNKALDRKYLKDQNQELQKLLSNQSKEKEIKNLHDDLEETVKVRMDNFDRNNTEIQVIHADIMQVLLYTLELNEGNYKGYSRNVASQVKWLAQSLKLSDKEINTLYLSALLHNIGKKGLPMNIMFKPFNTLTPKEHKLFIQYPVFGYIVWSAYASLKEVAHAILSHRERYDGRGYPYGLKSKNIPLASRILAPVVDYNELRYGLIDSQKYPAKLALKYLNDHFERYDPAILPVFIKIISLQLDERVIIEEVLNPDQIKPGMILSRPIMSKTGFAFLMKGYILNHDIIEKIKLLNGVDVYVKKDPVV